MSQMMKDAEKAAEALLFLKSLYLRYNDEFNLTSVRINGCDGLPTILVGPAILDSIIDKDEWRWEFRGASTYPFGAKACRFGVEFEAVLKSSEAEGFGCPQEVLDELDSDS